MSALTLLTLLMLPREIMLGESKLPMSESSVPARTLLMLPREIMFGEAKLPMSESSVRASAYITHVTQRDHVW